MKNRIVIIIITLLLVVVGGYFGYEHIKEEYPSAFRVQITSDGHTEYVDYWEGPDGNIYVFLPGYVAYEDAVIALETSNDVYIGGQLLEDGMSCSAFEKDCFYEFSYTSWGRKYSYRIMFMQSANVATLYVDTASGNMDYIHEEKGNEESGELVLYTADGALNYTGKIDSIKGRGNDTWNARDKKPYSVKLEDSVELLGMEPAQKWILLANDNDPTHFNNKVVFDFAKRLGLAYSPDSEWVDLYLNNEYAGVYLLCERIEIGEGRVEIAQTTERLDTGYLVSQEIVERMSGQGLKYVTTGAGVGIRVHEPQEPSGLQMNEIALQFQAIERAVMAVDGIDPYTNMHYEELIDTDSWVKKYLIEEFFMNLDAGYGSQYYYCDSEIGDVIYAGPVWDFDNAMASLKIMQPETFIANREYVNAQGYTPWYHELYKKENFYSEVVRVYQEEFLPELYKLESETIPLYADKLSCAAHMNQVRWYADAEKDFEESVVATYDFLERREAFLNSAWIENTKYHMIGIDTGEFNFYIYYSVPVGGVIGELPVLPEQEGLRFAGWYCEDTGEPFDPEQPITGDMHIYAKWEATE